MTKKFKISKSDFIDKANLLHNFKYSYSNIETEFIDYKTPIPINCNIHGIFYQPYCRHIRQKAGCKKCATDFIGKTKRINPDTYISKFKIIHNNFYDYSNAYFSTSTSKIKIICPIHGEFEQAPIQHLKGRGCFLCGKVKNHKSLRRTLKDFIDQANIIHNNKYDYRLITNYINSSTKLPIICPKHGKFMQAPYNHLFGSGRGGPAGCHKCFTSTGETKIRNFLCENDIEHIPQYIFNDCIYKKPLKFDFYLPSNNLCIEYDGEQHYKPIQFGSITIEEAKENLKLTKIKDEIKNEYCKDNGINLLRISYFEKNDIDIILTKHLKTKDTYNNFI